MTTSKNQQRAMILLRDGYVKCAYCDVLVPASEFIVEHATPRSRGGGSTIMNLVGSCNRCDKDKGPLTAEEFRACRRDPARRKALIAEVHALQRARLEAAEGLAIAHTTTESLAEFDGAVMEFIDYMPHRIGSGRSR